NTPGGNGAVYNEYGQIFYGCEKLRSFVIQNGVTEIAPYVFRNCEYLRYVTFADSVRKIGVSAFENCIGMPKLNLGAGVEEIGESAFKGCAGLIQVVLPANLKTISKDAFRNCVNMTDCTISRTVSSIGDDAFTNTKVTLYVPRSSYAAAWAIDHDIPFTYFSDGSEDENSVLVSGESYYTSDISTASLNQFIPLQLKYRIKDDVFEQMSDMYVSFRLSTSLVRVGIVTVNGKLVNVTTEENGFRCTVDEKEGTISLYVKPTGYGQLASYARFEYTVNGEQSAELIDTVKLNVPLLTIDAPVSASSSAIRVTGISEPGSEVDLYVDNVKKTTARTLASGTYSAVIRLADQMTDGKIYHVKAVLSDSEQITAVTTVRYHAEMPELTYFVMHYQAHENLMLDLLHSGKTTNNVYIYPGTPQTFVIRFDNYSGITTVFVKSSKNGEVKYMKAEPSAKAGEYIASGYFDENNHRYVPGNISVCYLTDQGSYTFSPEDLNDNAVFTDALINAEVSDPVVTREENKESVTQTIILDDDDHTQIVVEAEAEKKHMTHSQLTDEGFMISPYDQNTYIKFEYQDFDMLTLIYSQTEGNDGTLLKFALKEAGVLGLPLYALTDVVMSMEFTMVQYAMYVFEIECMNISPEEKARLKREAQELAIKHMLGGLFDTGLSKLGEIELLGIKIGDVIDVVKDIINGNVSDLINDVFGHEIGSLLEYFTKAMGFEFEWIVRWLIDPSGYVYEAVTSNRVEGATVTAWFRETMDDEPVMWDASEYEQENPLTSDSMGTYSWNTPEGYWQIRVEKEGYESWQSEWLPVPPIQTEVNASLVSKAVPEVEWMNVYEDSVQIKFTKYMDPSTLKGIQILGPDGSPVEYELEYAEETDENGNVYADLFTLKVTGTNTIGEEYTIVLPEGMLSYAEVACASDSIKKTCVRALSMETEDYAEVDYGARTEIKVTVLPDDGVNYISAATDSDTIIRVIDVAKGEGEGIYNVIVEGRLPGEAELHLSLKDTDITKSVKVKVNMNSTFPGFDDETTEPESIRLNLSEAELKPGETVDLKAEVLPEDADDTVTWTTSNPAIAAVNEKGTVTAIAEGSAVITAETVNGLKAECVITVVEEVHEHTYGTPEYTWSEDNSTVTAKASCTGCDDVITETVNTSYEVIKEPTESEEGTGRYTAVFTNELFETQTKDVSIPKLIHEHTYGTPEYTWSEDNSTVTAKVSCTGCDLVITETVNTDYEVIKEPTESEEGLGRYTADFTNVRFETQTKDVTIPKLAHEHTYGTPEYTWSEDNSKVTAKASCTGCDEVITETVNTSYEVIKEPTESEEGLGRYTADFTNELFETQTKEVPIPAIAAILPESITLNIKNAATTIARPVQLSATVLPENAEDRSVRWTSSDEAVAAVDANGKVTGKKPGTVVITAETVNGLKATCNVRILFTDVADSTRYFFDSVYWAVDKNITVGYGGVDLFSPNYPVTRGQLVTFLYRLAGEPEVTEDSGFDDVDPAKFYAKPIAWAASNKITTGYAGRNEFGPDDKCTREQIVTFLWRYAKSPKPQKTTNFTDSKAGAYYLDALSWAAEKNITVGLNDGTGRFGIGQDCTRAMTVT
ncbi:MAG: leucine-rich repeat protein, partial [Erysipelotrichaceae bacterium]|nr:leucine-rich repeat protein [Erysipelotrichaceae bacterium]